MCVGDGGQAGAVEGLGGKEFSLFLPKNKHNSWGPNWVPGPRVHRMFFSTA